MLFALLFTLAAAAVDGPPSMVAVELGDDGSSEYVAVPSGDAVHFDTQGPTKLIVESRRRMAGPSQRARPAIIEALGDGNVILTIRVPGIAVANGAIADAIGGYPSKNERSVVTVPPGGKQLTLRAPAGGPDFLVRVTRRSGELLFPKGFSTPDAKPTPPAVTIQPKPAAPLLTTTSQSPPQQAAVALGPAAGLGIGVGRAHRGSGLVPHIHAVGRLPIYEDLVSAGATIGAHRITVDEAHTIGVPYGGYATQTITYQTLVIPIEAHAGVHVQTGPVTTVGAAGLALSIARRSDGDRTATNIALGPSIGLGVERAVGSGIARILAEWTASQATFGNTDSTGSLARESLAVTRTTIQYLFPF